MSPSGLLSGSDPALDQPGGSQQTSTPARVPALGVGLSKDPLYILEAPEIPKPKQTWTKPFQSFLDDTPPAIPPRLPIPPPSVTPENPFRTQTLPRDVNLFRPDVDQPKVDLDFDSINESLLKLNETPPPRPRRDQSGKPVARSKTLPPQVPPRTYQPIAKSNKNQHRVSADPVRPGLVLV